MHHTENICTSSCSERAPLPRISGKHTLLRVPQVHSISWAKATDTVSSTKASRSKYNVDGQYSTRWWFHSFKFVPFGNWSNFTNIFQLGQDAISIDVACLPVMRRRWTSQMAMVCALSVEAFRWTWSIPSWHLVTQVVFSQMIRPKLWTEKGDQWSCHGSKEMTLIHRSKEMVKSASWEPLLHLLGAMNWWVQIHPIFIPIH